MTEYELIELGTLGGRESSAAAINEAGFVVGTACLPCDDEAAFAEIHGFEGGPRHAFIWREGEMTSLDTPDCVLSEAYSISNNGKVVGRRCPDLSVLGNAFLFADGQLRTLEYPAAKGSKALAINQQDQIVGVVFLPVESPIPHKQEYAVLWQPDGGQLRLELNQDYIQSATALAINNVGQIVGMVDGIPFIYDDGDFELIGFPGSQVGRATSVNDRGQVAGYASSAKGYDHAFFWDSGETRALGTFGGKGSTASGVNNHGHVVGEAGMPGSDPNEGWNYHAFLWLGSDLIDLNEHIRKSHGWTVRNATGINDHGQICGIATRDDVEWAVLLNPRK